MKASSDMGDSSSTSGFGSVLGTLVPMAATLATRPINLLVGPGRRTEPASVKLAAHSPPNVKLAAHSAADAPTLNIHDGVATAALCDHGVRRDVGAGHPGRRGEPRAGFP